MLFRNKQDCLSFLNISSSMHTTVVGSVITDLKLSEVRATFLEPIEKLLEASPFRIIDSDVIIFFVFLLCLFIELNEVFI